MNGNRPLVTTFFVVQLYDPGTGSGFGPLNYFDLEIARTVNKRLPLTPEMIEKWWCIGDTRNRKRVWIQGHQVKDSAL